MRNDIKVGLFVAVALASLYIRKAAKAVKEETRINAEIADLYDMERSRRTASFVVKDNEDRELIEKAFQKVKVRAEKGQYKTTDDAMNDLKFEVIVSHLES